MIKYYKLLLLFVFPLYGYAQPLNPWTPPEYFPSKAVLIEWDFNTYTWSLYAELIAECRLATEVILVVRDQAEEDQMRSLLTSEGIPLSGISFVQVPCERMWIRDHGPLAVKTDQGVAFMDFDDLANSGLDENLPTNLANLWGIDSYSLPYVLCGGNFMVDNHNRLFTTTRLYSNNPGYTRAHINQVFEDYMGITEILTFAPQHSDYWGHIDMQIKLLDDTTFVISEVSPGSGANYDSLEANYARLQSLPGPHGKPYRIERLQMADDWKTYANSLILNDRVLVPTYNHILDSTALDAYARLLPDHHIVGINCNKIIGWEGALHCITMQLFDEAQLTSVRNLSIRDNGIHLFPNPLMQGENLCIQFTGEQSLPATVRVLTLQGQVLQSLSWLSGDSFSFSWPHSSGAYILEVSCASGKYSQTVFTE
jgi:agmatine deiminase